MKTDGGCTADPCARASGGERSRAPARSRGVVAQPHRSLRGRAEPRGQVNIIGSQRRFRRRADPARGPRPGPGRAGTRSGAAALPSSTRSSSSAARRRPQRRPATRLPTLRKDFIVDPYRSGVALHRRGRVIYRGRRRRRPLAHSGGGARRRRSDIEVHDATTSSCLPLGPRSWAQQRNRSTLVRPQRARLVDAITDDVVAAPRRPERAGEIRAFECRFEAFSWRPPAGRHRRPPGAASGARTRAARAPVGRAARLGPRRGEDLRNHFGGGRVGGGGGGRGRGGVRVLAREPARGGPRDRARHRGGAAPVRPARRGVRGCLSGGDASRGGRGRPRHGAAPRKRVAGSGVPRAAACGQGRARRPRLPAGRGAPLRRSGGRPPARQRSGGDGVPGGTDGVVGRCTPVREGRVVLSAGASSENVASHRACVRTGGLSSGWRRAGKGRTRRRCARSSRGEGTK